MKILVANLGSTSFKYRLFDMADERQLARGGIERIGSAESRCVRRDRRQATRADRRTCPTMPWRCGMCLEQLTDPQNGCLKDAGGGGGHRLQGGAWRRDQRRAAGDADVLAAMEAMSRRRAGPQSALHRGHAAAEREVAGDSAGGRVRDRLSRRRFPTAIAYYAVPVRVGREASRQALGLSRRQPSLHRRRARPSCWAATICGSSPATWADRTRCARFAAARAWPPAWA